MDTQLMHGLHRCGPVCLESQARHTPVLPDRMERCPVPALGTGISPVPAAYVLWIVPPAPEVGTDGSCQGFSGHCYFLPKQLVTCL